MKKKKYLISSLVVVRPKADGMPSGVTGWWQNMTYTPDTIGKDGGTLKKRFLLEPREMTSCKLPVIYILG